MIPRHWLLCFTPRLMEFCICDPKYTPQSTDTFKLQAFEMQQVWEGLSDLLIPLKRVIHKSLAGEVPSL